MKTVSIKTGNRRLLRLADYVERRQRAKPKAGYNQRRVVHDCGAPACLLGHADALFHGPVYLEFFAVEAAESVELFHNNGCGNARTDWRKAVAYVRAFVARRAAEDSI